MGAMPDQNLNVTGREAQQRARELPKIPTMSSLFVHKYVFRRPRLRQRRDEAVKEDTAAELGSSGVERGTTFTQGSSLTDDDGTQKSLKEVETQRGYLNLFIDLLWVGIVSNISETFSDSAFDDEDGAFGNALLEFLILFLSSWRIWNYLRTFLNDWFNKDLLQSWFITWILLIVLFYGNSAPFFLLEDSSLVVGTYLLARGSFLAVEGLYCIFVPEVRQRYIISCAAAVVPVALWVASIWSPWPKKAGFIISALVIEALCLVILESFGSKATEKSIDAEGVVERLQGFFTIILGEGVFLLIKAEPTVSGVTSQSGQKMLCLIIYYGLFSMYINGDRSKTTVHALVRSRWSSSFFLSLHVFLYGTVLLLAGSIPVLIKDGPESEPVPDIASSASGTFFLPDSQLPSHLLWTICLSLAGSMVCLLCMALSHSSLDRRGTLLVDNRYVRLAPRAIAAIVSVCLPLAKNMEVRLLLSIMALLVQIAVSAEYFMAMERGARLFEPMDSE